MQLAPILWATWVKRAPVSLLPGIFYHQNLFHKNIFACASGMTDRKTKGRGSCRPQLIIVPNIKTFLSAVTEISGWTDRWTDRHTQFLRLTTGIGPVVNKNKVGFFLPGYSVDTGQHLLWCGLIHQGSLQLLLHQLCHCSMQ